MIGLSDRFKTLATGGVALAMLATVAVAPVAAQDASPAAGGEVAPYQAPDGIESLSGSVAIDGSSTVGPISEAVAEEFRSVAPEVDAIVNISGTGGGFERFCTGETDINDASRAIVPDEVATCEENGVEWYELRIATDGLAHVVNPENDFADCLTVEQLAEVWQVNSEITTWDQVDADFPAETIGLYGPDPDSGTYDYWVEIVDETTGTESGIRADYTASVDDNVLVEGVAGDPNALGYFGYAYYEQNQDSLSVLGIDGGDGCVEPSSETVQDGTYPLARPLFIYVKAESLQDPAVQEFVQFYIANAPELVADVGYFQAPTERLVEDQEKLDAAISGDEQPDSQATGTPEA